MLETVLVPLDGSELGESVLPYVQELASKFGSEVILLRVAPTLAQLIALAGPGDGGPDGLDMSSADLIMEQQAIERKDAEDYLGMVRQRLEEAGVRVRTEVREGVAGEAILAYAEACGASLIAMCTHGRGGLGRLVFGSVTDHVLRNAPHVPMFLVRAGEEDGEAGSE